MSYASHTRRPNPAALAGAIGSPAAVAALLVVGLALGQWWLFRRLRWV